MDCVSNANIKPMGVVMDYRDGGQLTVEELIDILKEMPKDAVVWHEGCDCYGAGNGVEYDEKDNSILITRCH